MAGQIALIIIAACSGIFGFFIAGESRYETLGWLFGITLNLVSLLLLYVALHG